MNGCNACDAGKQVGDLRPGSYGRIHSIQTLGAVDGPGLRYVLFMQGCPLRCLFCHNPDSWALKGKAKKIGVESLLNDILCYKAFLKNGGVTATGGEPLLQAEFLARLFESCQAEGVHTALDTAGSLLVDDRVKTLLSHTDLVLLDIKCMDPAIYQRLTTGELAKTLRFADYLKEQGIACCIRHVLVPGITDDRTLLERLADYIKRLGAIVKRVELLPFHQMGKAKWERLGLRYTLAGLEPLSEAGLREAEAIFASYGLPL